MKPPAAWWFARLTDSLVIVTASVLSGVVTGSLGWGIFTSICAAVFLRVFRGDEE